MNRLSSVSKKSGAVHPCYRPRIAAPAAHQCSAVVKWRAILRCKCSRFRNAEKLSTKQSCLQT